VSEPLDYRVTEVVIEASHKAWQQGMTQKGISGGTGITWKVVPPPSTEGWTPDEAKRVTLEIRREQERLLVTDAIARGAPEPEGGKEAIKAYDVAIRMMNGRGISPEEAVREVQAQKK
jgi:hypothetical protein